MTLVHRHEWRAMATRFTATLVGDDAEHLEAVSAAVEDETRRLDAELSRFNPASTISRINLEAADRFVRVDVETWELLQACEVFREETQGAFDVAAGSPDVATSPRLLFDPEARAVRFASAGVRIDLGGVGKGYALERARALLDRFRIASGLLSAGASSILPLKRAPDGPWSVVFGGTQLMLEDCGVSCSATRRPGQPESDLIDPRTGRPLDGDDTCLVIAASATEAEIFSTALLAMGGAAARRYLEANPARGLQVGWIAADRPTETTWLTGRCREVLV